MLGNAGARQLLLFAKPWQRALVGAARVGVGLAIGALAITVVGAVVVMTTLFVAAARQCFRKGRSVAAATKTATEGLTSRPPLGEDVRLPELRRHVRGRS